MKVLVCDVCGKEIKHGWKYKIGFKPVLLCQTIYGSGYGMKDICEDCFDRIKKEIKEKQNDQAKSNRNPRRSKRT